MRILLNKFFSHDRLLSSSSSPPSIVIKLDLFIENRRFRFTQKFFSLLEFDVLLKRLDRTTNPTTHSVAAFSLLLMYGSPIIHLLRVVLVILPLFHIQSSLEFRVIFKQTDLIVTLRELFPNKTCNFKQKWRSQLGTGRIANSYMERMQRSA